MFGYLVVALLAVAVGVGVYLVAMRFAPPPGDPERAPAGADAGFVPDDAGGIAAQGPPRDAPVGSSYIPVTPSRPSWQRRVVGLIGLLIAIVVGSAAVAFALYLLVQFITRLATG